MTPVLQNDALLKHIDFLQYEPTCCPVLQWRAVQVAKQSVGDRIQKHLTLPLSQLADRESEQDHQEPPLALP